MCMTLLQPHGLQHTTLPCPSPTPGVCANSCSLSRWCHPTTSSSVIPVSSCLQSFPASGSFPVSQLFPSSGQSIGASVSAAVFPMNIQDWFPLGLTSLISLHSKGLSGVFSRPIPVRNHILKSSLVVQWLRLCPSSTGGAGLIPGWRTKIPHAVLWGQKKKIKESHFVARTKELTTESQTN